MNRQELINELLSDPYKLTLKKPFYRGSSTYEVNDVSNGESHRITDLRPAILPNVQKMIVSQDKFLKEYDPNSHDIMFDKNIPSICVKLEGGGYQEIKWQRMPLPMQKRIVEKKVLHLCGYPVQFTLQNTDPTDKETENFISFKNAWKKKNQDGMRTKAVHAQMYQGDCALLFYHNYRGEIKSRLLTYEDGYQIITHNDQNGDRLLDVIYYRDSNDIEHLDCYDDTFVYAMTNTDAQSENGWAVMKKKHGFSESPVATRRDTVAWNAVEDLIEAYEIIYNIFLVIQKRHGWGILYIKGNFSENARKIAGSVILQDKSVEGNGSADFKTPPSPEGMLDSLKSLFNQIQIGSSTTFLLPEDIKASGDVSGLAVMLTQSLDIEGGNLAIIEWQNFADKCCRLFKEGYAKELVNNGTNPSAVTEFEKMEICASYKLWRPFSSSEYNQMLATLKNSGLLSQKTGIELNTESKPDETARIRKETEEAERKAEEKAQKEMQYQQATVQAQNNKEE